MNKTLADCAKCEMLRTCSAHTHDNPGWHPTAYTAKDPCEVDIYDM